MAIGSTAFLGKLISEELSNYLRAYTDKFDRINVAEMKDIKVGSSTIREVIYRNVNLTTDNSKAINELMKIAIQNCMKAKREAVQAEKNLKTVQRKIQTIIGEWH